MSVLVGKHIKNMLFNSELANKVDNKIYLDGLNRETSFPFIVYTYSVTPELGTKDGNMDNCLVNVYVFSKDGDSSLELADEVRRLLEHSEGDYEGFSVLDTEFSSYRGSLEEDVYVRELEFNIKTSY